MAKFNYRAVYYNDATHEDEFLGDATSKASAEELASKKIGTLRDLEKVDTDLGFFFRKGDERVEIRVSPTTDDAEVDGAETAVAEAPAYFDQLD